MRHVRGIGKASLVALLLVGGVAIAQDHGNSEERRAKIRERMSKDDGAPKVGDAAPTDWGCQGVSWLIA